MARTLIVNEIKKDSSATAMSVDGVAKTWVNFAGIGTITINQSLNVTSLTDDGTGLYLANFAADMEYADFVTSVVATTVWHCFSNSQSVSSFGVRSGSSGHVNYDATKIHGTVHGDLA